MNSEELVLNFNYELNHKLQYIDEKHIFEYAGTISKLYSPHYPIDIGVFSVMVLNLEKAHKFNDEQRTIEGLSELSDDFESSFGSVNRILLDFGLNLMSKNKVIFVKDVMIRPDYRGMGITKELMKSIYLTLYESDSFIFTNATPIQHLPVDMEMYLKDYLVDLNIKGDEFNPEEVMVGGYFGLDKLPTVDQEIEEFKIFGLCNTLHMKRFEDTPFFYYENEKDILKNFEN